MCLLKKGFLKPNLESLPASAIRKLCDLQPVLESGPVSNERYE